MSWEELSTNGGVASVCKRFKEVFAHPGSIGSELLLTTFLPADRWFASTYGFEIGNSDTDQTPSPRLQCMRMRIVRGGASLCSAACVDGWQALRLFFNCRRFRVTQSQSEHTQLANKLARVTALTLTHIGDADGHVPSELMELAELGLMNWGRDVPLEAFHLKCARYSSPPSTGTICQLLLALKWHVKDVLGVHTKGSSNPVLHTLSIQGVTACRAVLEVVAEVAVFCPSLTSLSIEVREILPNEYIALFVAGDATPDPDLQWQPRLPRQLTRLDLQIEAPVRDDPAAYLTLLRDLPHLTDLTLKSNRAVILGERLNGLKRLKLLSSAVAAGFQPMQLHTLVVEDRNWAQLLRHVLDCQCQYRVRSNQSPSTAAVTSAHTTAAGAAASVPGRVSASASTLPAGISLESASNGDVLTAPLQRLVLSADDPTAVVGTEPIPPALTDLDLHAVRMLSVVGHTVSLFTHTSLTPLRRLRARVYRYIELEELLGCRWASLKVLHLSLWSGHIGGSTRFLEKLGGLCLLSGLCELELSDLAEHGRLASLKELARLPLLSRLALRFSAHHTSQPPAAFATRLVEWCARCARLTELQLSHPGLEEVPVKSWLTWSRLTLLTTATVPMRAVAALTEYISSVWHPQFVTPTHSF